MPPYRLATLTWDQLDSLLVGQDVRRQKDMIGFRKLAALQFNLAVEPKDRMSESAFMALPAIDGPSGIASPKKVDEAWMARMKEKYGNKLEL